VGLASLNVEHPRSADALVALADRALYAAKDRGGNQIIPFSQTSVAASA
jgi:GGDEF domain-containing protein